MKEPRAFEEMLPPWKLAGMEPDSSVLVGFSGGADSALLLHLLCRMGKQQGFSVTAAHVNHGIRGEEADRDETFCMETCRSLGCELKVLHADVPKLSEEHGTGLEEEAREIRYRFFSDLMKENNIPILVTAHHGDDQLETLLLRISRGTGLRGLCGILPVRRFGTGVLVRPLLPYSEAGIRQYCEENHIAYIKDSTNFDKTYRRNRIRWDAVPAMEYVCGDVQKNVYRMTETLRSDLDYLDREAELFRKENRCGGSYPLEALQTLHPSIFRRVLEQETGLPLEQIHTEAVKSLIAKGNSDSGVSLPRNFSAYVQNRRFFILPDLPPFRQDAEIPFQEGALPLCDGKMILWVRKKENCKERRNVHKLSTTLCIMFNEEVSQASPKIFWRAARQGDSLLKNGMHKKIRKLYREAGVPPVLREALPVLSDGKDILYVPFVGMRDCILNSEIHTEHYEITVAAENSRKDRKEF